MIQKWDEVGDIGPLLKEFLSRDFDSQIFVMIWPSLVALRSGVMGARFGLSGFPDCFKQSGKVHGNVQTLIPVLLPVPLPILLPVGSPL